MSALAAEDATPDVSSIFYTHEAQPAEYYLHLTSLAQKFRNARDLHCRVITR